MMAIKYNSNYNETLPFSDVSYNVSLTANTEQVITIPGSDTQYYQAYFSYNDTTNIFVGLNTVPTLPLPNTVETQQYAEFRPIKRYVRGGDQLHFITPDAAAYCGMSLRALI